MSNTARDKFVIARDSELHDPPHFLIVGSPRSGTTLVQRLATELPGVQVTAETHFFPFLFKRIVKASEFPLNEVELRRVLTAYSQLPPVRGLQFSIDDIVNRLSGRCRDAWVLFSEIVRQLAPGATLIGEKTPNHLRWWRPLHEARPGLKLVWIVRDPRAVAASGADVPFGMNSTLLLAASWRGDIEDLRAVRLQLDSDHLLIIKYEEVVKAPATVQTKLAEFLGVTGAPVPIEERGLSLFPQWEAEWKARALEPVDSARITAWKGRLRPDEVARIEMLTRSGMREFGYEPLYPESRQRASMVRVSPREALRLFRSVRSRAKERRWIESIVLSSALG